MQDIMQSNYFSTCLSYFLCYEHKFSFYVMNVESGKCTVFLCAVA